MRTLIVGVSLALFAIGCGNAPNPVAPAAPVSPLAGTYVGTGQFITEGRFSQCPASLTISGTGTLSALSLQGECGITIPLDNLSVDAESGIVTGSGTQQTGATAACGEYGVSVSGYVSAGRLSLAIQYAYKPPCTPFQVVAELVRQ